MIKLQRFQKNKKAISLNPSYILKPYKNCNRHEILNKLKNLLYRLLFYYKIVTFLTLRTTGRIGIGGTQSEIDSRKVCMALGWQSF